jgi:hypothetical protein
MKATLIPINHIEDIWPQIKDYLKGAADYTFGRYTVEDIYKGLFVKPQELWIAFENEVIYGVVVTEIVEYPQMKALVMHFTGGKELPKWKNEMLALLQKYARDKQCSIIESYGRRGWGNVFKNDGYKERFTFYELPVE